MNDVTVNVVIVVMKALAASYKATDSTSPPFNPEHVAVQLDALAKLLESAKE